MQTAGTPLRQYFARPRVGLDDAGAVLDEQLLRDVADEIVGVGGVMGVVLGGSRASGEHTPASDVDLGLYYRPPLDVVELQVTARRRAGPAATAGRLPGAPDRFTERAHTALAHLGRQPHDLERALALAEQLLADTSAACRAVP